MKKKNNTPPQLRLTEIFLSIQGESLTTGLPTVFIRLTGCPLRCTYCDTAYAFHGGKQRDLPSIVDQIATYGVNYVLVTGGEPLAQPNTLPLLVTLCDLGYQVSLETSGALDISAVDPRVTKVVDIKTPASGESERNMWANMEALRPQDQLKFVICNRQDYEWSKMIIDKKDLTNKMPLLFSPSHGVVHPKQLAEWILADRLPVRLQIQLHKYLWGDIPGH